MADITRFSDTISYLLKRLKDEKPIERFDILLSSAEWKTINNKRPVAWAILAEDGSIKEVKLKKDEKDNPYMTIPLYR